MNQVVLVASLLIMACDTATKKDANNGNAEADKTIHSNDTSTSHIPTEGCYTWVVKKDTATIQLTVSGNSVSGKLIYHWAEKDKNAGTIDGTIKDNLIVAYYNFHSEGITSVRQVAFKINNDELIEGYGDYNPGSDTFTFKNIDQLAFQHDRPFKKIACQ